ncbi:ATP-binding protein [Kitasatospora sp. NBC_00240]|uniref:ATP-binding protein n=1 Tax=Kitasatospora sp. NBC_00240 TaxID=2903567 RepID=UPI00225451B6|nr:ATP-binding protein [Kitasatospora sp. NBC_00240]MCX5213726.1 ATP-binding protein [Kitasatospora sp. NBC_00240]
MPGTLDRPSPAVTVDFAAWLPRHRRSAGAARRLLRTFLGPLDGGEQLLELGELLAGELVANAVEHARGPSGRLVEVRYAVTAGRLRIEVHDAGNELPEVREPAPEEESGRGLWLVRELSAAWGCCPRAGGAGKCVWAVVGPVAPTGGEPPARPGTDVPAQGATGREAAA